MIKTTIRTKVKIEQDENGYYIILPEDIIKSLNIKEGDEVEYIVKYSNEVLIKPKE